MLGALLVLCACVYAFVWYLQKARDGESDAVSNKEGFQNQLQPGGADGGRRRNRRQGKRHREKGSPNNEIPSQQLSARSVTEKSIRKAEATARKQAVQEQEWPALGSVAGGARDRKPNPIESEQDLAALHAALLKAKETQTETNDATSNGGRGRDTGRAGVGDRVEARFGGGVQWFPATVTKTLHGGLVNLAYDDGGKETRVHTSLLRRPGARSREGGHEKTDSGSDENSDTENSPVEFSGHLRGGQMAGGWEVQTQKVRKPPQERQEARVEASTNLKNRNKRQKKREKELAAREALRKKL